MEGFHRLLAPHRDSAPSRERKEKTAYKNRPGADTIAELCPLDPMMIGLELVSTSTLSITSQDIINNIITRIKTLLTKAPKTRNYVNSCIGTTQGRKNSVSERIRIKMFSSEYLYAYKHRQYS